MAKYDWDTLWPQVQELQAEGKTIVAIAEEMNINLYALKSKLWRERQKEEQQTQPPESDELGGTDPIQEEKEPAENSVPKLVPLGAELPWEDDTITQYNEQIKQGGFTAADEEPIPYTPVENPFDLNRFKIAVLEIFQEVARANQAPAYVSLAFMNAIIDTYPEKGE